MATTPSELERYRRALRMDPQGSDIAEVATRQSSQHNEICTNYVYAKSRLASAGTSLDDHLNAGIRDLRVKPAHKKTTVTELKGLVKAEQAYGDLVLQQSKAATDVDMWKSLRESSRQRKDMVRAVVDLLINGHLDSARAANPPTPEDKKAYTDRRNKMIDERRLKIREKSDTNGKD